MPDLSRNVNDLSDEYRSHWSISTAGVAGVAEFIGTSRHLRQIDPPSLVRVIQADLEKSWSHWATSAEELAKQSVSSDMLIEEWKRLPRFQNYAALFSGPEALRPFWAQLANCEAVCRDRWGDAIGSPFYEYYFEVTTQGYPRRQRRYLRCEFEHNEEFSQVLFPLRGRNEIGRQRTKDTEPYFCETNADGNRIVVANRYESEVSREQMTIQLLTPNVAIVFNRSGVNSIRLATDAVLTPGANACTLFPFTVQIPGRKLCCY